MTAESHKPLSAMSMCRQHAELPVHRRLKLLQRRHQNHAAMRPAGCSALRVELLCELNLIPPEWRHLWLANWSKRDASSFSQCWCQRGDAWARRAYFTSDFLSCALAATNIYSTRWGEVEQEEGASHCTRTRRKRMQHAVNMNVQRLGHAGVVEWFAV